MILDWQLVMILDWQLAMKRNMAYAWRLFVIIC